MGIMGTGYESYSVGAFDAQGNPIGGEFSVREDAEVIFRELQNGKPRQIASAVLYGWTSDGECEQLDGWNL
jgi:hypothetical protein